ncbi:MAG: hypothetical protein RIS29_1043 [Bacteroidota bacterium]|jgi:multimeric flavodoxin WrbA
MKVVAINGSPRKEGNTATSLKRFGERLNAHGIEFESILIGNKAIHGCIGCGKCRENKNDSCGIKNDALNELIPTIKEADGLLIASPVYYSGIAGTMKSFLDRLFYVSGSNGNYFRHKVGAALCSLRRSGGSHTLDGLYHYLTYAEMMVATSNYWNIIHGGAPGQAAEDMEGIQIVDVLADNMAWMLKMREATRHTVPAPEPQQKVMMNFIR